MSMLEPTYALLVRPPCDKAGSPAGDCTRSLLLHIPCEFGRLANATSLLRAAENLSGAIFLQDCSAPLQRRKLPRSVDT